MWRKSKFTRNSVSNLVRRQRKHKMFKEEFGDNVTDLTQTCEWVKRFKRTRTSVDADELPGRPSTGSITERVAEVREAILEDRKGATDDVCDIVLLSRGTWRRILHTWGQHDTHCYDTTAEQWPSALGLRKRLQPINLGVTGTKHHLSQWKTPPRPKEERQVQNVIPHRPYSPDLKTLVIFSQKLSL
jgi:hypothetical protein